MNRTNLLENKNKEHTSQPALPHTDKIPAAEKPKAKDSNKQRRIKNSEVLEKTASTQIKTGNKDEHNTPTIDNDCKTAAYIKEEKI